MAFAYSRDRRGVLSRVVREREIAAQHGAFDPDQSDRNRAWAAAFDADRVRRQQQNAARFASALSLGVVVVLTLAR